MPSSEITKYITEINGIYQRGNATEHSFRPALLRLLEALVNVKGVNFTNEPKRIACGAPDYIVTKNDIPIGYIEAKDIGIDITNGKANKEQFDRYKQSLDNIVFTDYLDFHLYRKGEFVESVKIAEIKGDKILPKAENFEKFEQIINEFINIHPQGITSSADLAKMMAGKARLMAQVIEKILGTDDDNNLAEQMAAFKKVLIQDITQKDFADVYAQTIAYGLFAARLHDKNPDTFSRQKAANLIPKTNPFLRQLFQNIAGFDLDERICWIVDDLADTFSIANMSVLKNEFSERTNRNDPIIHFYEDFLSAYDPILRKSRGVWYTPQAVVNFIVRAVDEILQKEFKLPMGLADTSKTKIKAASKTGNAADSTETEIHKVQILDPATGTGTFLAETVRQIYEKFRGQSGMWQSYVKEHLIPRINGFELLMASYTMAHIKLEHLLTQTGYNATDNQRLRVYLTNSLEEHHSGTESLFARFLAQEANEANGIKRDTPVMVVLGNPPYSGESQNKSDWIMRLMLDYKKEPDTNLLLQERNQKWINDDYCKFIRLGQHFVDKNNEGVLAYINNHSFVDNPTFRGMRWNLMKSFDKFYIIDLHGNSKKKEICPDGSKDENVFDIQQGVSINVFVKTGCKPQNALAEVFHFDIYGRRNEKYDYLADNNFFEIPFTKLKPSAPEYFFVPKNYDVKEEYEKGFSVQELFPVNSVGIVTARDDLTIHNTANAVKDTVNEFIGLDVETARKKFNLGKDARDWSVAGAQKDLTSKPDFSKIVNVNYRPLDIRYTYYTGNSKGFHCMPRGNVMRHFLKGENVGLVVPKISKEDNCVFISNKIIGHKFCSAYDSNSVFPLYLYDEILGKTEKSANLNKEIVAQIQKNLQLKKPLTPEQIFDYVYAVLHSLTYREKYKEFLKIDFPRIPYPETARQFLRLVELGEKLRKLHLLENVEPQQGTADYPISGSDEIETPKYEDNKVWINSAQYFDNVPAETWEFYIGGYQPAQKWLKDRKGRKLDFEDIRHYRRMVLVLRETVKVMGEVELG